MEFNLSQIKQEYEKILQQLANSELVSNPQRLEELSKKYNILKKMVEKIEEIEEIKKIILENEEIIKSKEDADLTNLAEEEISYLSSKKEGFEKELEALTRIAKEEKNTSVIIEIRAGTGGEEAALFAASLFKMYSKYAQKKNWQITVLDSSSSDLGGLKEIIFEVKNHNIFSELRFEAGVHRVQRIPETEKSGRIHTSTATVAILCKPEETEIEIKPRDLKFETFRASGPGGQYVQKRETAVRVTHLPTGITVSSQQARNQAQNREYALKILKARVLSTKISQESEKISKDRKQQIKGAERAEKIRTYNFPQDRITDHRIKKSWHHIQQIFDGNLKPIVEALSKSE